MTKIVAVSATRRTDEGRERVALNTAYVQALARAGLVPVVVPPTLDPDAACAVLDRVQGLVLSGGEDVEPARYGARPHPSSAKQIRRGMPWSSRSSRARSGAASPCSLSVGDSRY